MSSPYSDTPDFLATVTQKNYPTVNATVTGNQTVTLNVPVDNDVQSIIVTVATVKPWKMTVTVTGHTSGQTYGYFDQLTVPQVIVPVNPSVDTSVDVQIQSTDAATRHAYARPSAIALASNVVTNTPQASAADYYASGFTGQSATTTALKSFTSNRVPIIYGVLINAMISPSATSTNVGNVRVYAVDSAPDQFLLNGVYVTPARPATIYVPFPQGLQIQGWSTGAGCALNLVTTDISGTNVYTWSAVVWASL